MVATPADGARVQVFDSVWATLKVDGNKTAGVRCDCTIHGSSKLPHGYDFAYVSRDLDFEDDHESKSLVKISSSYNLVGALIALGQALYASFTLYQTRGDQITQYGYAAFGLTVTPFVVMSIINLLGNVLAPNYSALYMVDSSVMAEARRRDGCSITGVVGKLREGSTSELASQDERNNWISGLISFDQMNSNDQLHAHFRVAVGSTFEIPSLEAALLPTGDQNDIDLSLPPKGQLRVNEQEQTVSVLKNTHSNLAHDDHGGHQILCIPSCPQIQLRSGSSEQTARYTIMKTEGPPADLKISGGSSDDTGRAGGAFFFGVLVSIVTIAIIGGLSHFQPASSTASQRAWTMTWLSSSIILGLGAAASSIPTALENMKTEDSLLKRTLFFVVLGSVPAIGGLVVVGQMILQYGTCIQI